jgi:predicted ABC-type exoprotein transport system permease subunit
MLETIPSSVIYILLLCIAIPLIFLIGLQEFALAIILGCLALSILIRALVLRDARVMNEIPSHRMEGHNFVIWFLAFIPTAWTLHLSGYTP